MPIVCCLEEIANSSPAEWNAETRSDAQSLFFTVFRLSFVIALAATHNVLSYITGLSVILQGCYDDAIPAHREIQNVKSTLVSKGVMWKDFILKFTVKLLYYVRVSESKNQYQELPTDTKQTKYSI